jgi:O-6-methylguanine DNA methyltransferase
MFDLMPTITFTVAEHADWLVLVAKNPQGVCAISLGKFLTPLAENLKRDFPWADFEYKPPLLLPEWLEVSVLLNNPRYLCNFQLSQTGTSFQQDVWRVLCNIPCGQTLSYSQVAREIGKPEAVRAVAGACAANKLALVVPCHRVVRSNGAVSGYRWGADVKRLLLEQEASWVSSA